MKDIEDLFDSLERSIMENYHKDEKVVKEIVLGIIKTYLNDCIVDSFKLTYLEFSKKYISGYNAFEYCDFTTSEIKNIISETPLTERDRKIAISRYIDLKSEEDISYELSIDKKTVHYNIPKISKALKETCLKLYSK